MKTNLVLASFVVMPLLLFRPVEAQMFNSGSDGSYGSMNITNDTTLDLPTNGIFNCTTITVATNTILRFNRNALNTPVYLLATGIVTIAGTIDVSGSPGTSASGGAGGPGGFDGGAPGLSVSASGAGFGPGGGRPGSSSNTGDGAGSGSYAYDVRPKTNNGAVYGGPLLMPMLGGSGGGGAVSNGGGSSGGGGGGGAVLVSSNVRIDLTGAIRSEGGYSTIGYNGGSGGGIRLVAPVVAGTGALDVYPGDIRGGGVGRMRIDAMDRRSANFVFDPVGFVAGGAFMAVFITPLPRLDIVGVAGMNVVLGAPGPVTIQLPFGSTTNQTVTIRAENFNSVVPIAVVLTPEQGQPIKYLATIDNSASNPATNTINVAVPVNVVVTVNAWTR